MPIRPAESDADVAATFDVMRQLRPHLARETYVTQVRVLMGSDGYRLASLTDDAGVVRGVAGYRLLTML